MRWVGVDSGCLLFFAGCCEHGNVKLGYVKFWSISRMFDQPLARIKIFSIRSITISISGSGN